jgi:hypothetical protein
MTGDGNGGDILVFLGPSLPLREARALLPGAVFLPPARMGDLYRAARDRRGPATAIALIDGFLGTAPPVRHREILWAMAEGVRVLGAASMGALRAAELDALGMVGVGKIYAAYKAGRYPPFTDPFEDDAEVAVRQAPVELGSLPVSDAMVDLRETLAAAEAAGVIGRATRDALAAALGRLHFAERSLARLAEEAMALPEGAALAAWLRRGHAVSQKRRDAAALLRHLAAGGGVAAMAAPPGFAFERAQVWERFRAAADAADGAAWPRLVTAAAAA